MVLTSSLGELMEDKILQVLLNSAQFLYIYEFNGGVCVPGSHALHICQTETLSDKCVKHETHDHRHYHVIYIYIYIYIYILTQ